MYWAHHPSVLYTAVCTAVSSAMIAVAVDRRYDNLGTSACLLVLVMLYFVRTVEIFGVTITGSPRQGRLGGS